VKSSVANFARVIVDSVMDSFFMTSNGVGISIDVVTNVALDSHIGSVLRVNSMIRQTLNG
jgi:hypothetical protein